MRVLFVINVDWYFNLHWVARARYLLEQGYEVHVLTTFYDEKIKSALEGYGLRCHNINLKRRGVNLFKEACYLIQLLKSIKRIKPDLLHCVTVKPNIYGGLIASLFKTPLIVSVTGLGVVFSSDKLSYRFIRTIVTSIYRFVSINTKSKFIFENVEDLQRLKSLNIVNDNNGIVIKGAGVDVDEYSYSKPNNNNVALFAARLLYDKGLFDIIKAKEILNSKGLDFELKVAGLIDTDVDGAIPLSVIEKLTSDNKITWMGSVDNMSELLSEVDIVCLPTCYGEGVPRILIEAASCGRTLIATDVAGCREIVRNGYNGFLVNTKSPEEIASVLEKIILDNSLLLPMGLNGRNLVEKEYAQSIVLESLSSIYKEML